MDGVRTAPGKYGGDLATGIIYRLWRARYRVLCLETERPMVVRRTVSVAQAVFDGRYQIDGMEARAIRSLEEWDDLSSVAVLIPGGEDSFTNEAAPACRCHYGQKPGHASGNGFSCHRNRLGFSAPEDVHAVVETKRGHDLGRLITKERHSQHGDPGDGDGYTAERLLRAPCDGLFAPVCQIGDHVEAGQIIGAVNQENVYAQISGVVRGLIHPSVPVRQGNENRDVDPRNERSHCFSITDKALAIGGGSGGCFIHVLPKQ